MARKSLLGVTTLVGALSLAPCAACGPVPRAAISLSLAYEKKTPADASVSIDEQYIGPLGYVGAHSVRLPEGEHRVSVAKTGFFPWDRLITAGRDPIKLDVTLEPIPD